jgi:hypothetical protein
MRRQLHFCMLLGGAVGLAAITSIGSHAQQPEFTNNFKYNIGQSVQPVFEGWSRVPDGSFNMHFGYLNRNYVQEPHVPIGPNNNIEPGGPDRGQPTYFYTRTQRNLFTVNVPKDFGLTRELVWTVTANGKTERAVGWLQAEWEIDPRGGASQGGDTDPEIKKNKPPTVTINPVPAVKLPATATLTAKVADDGLPVPRGRGKPAVGQETPPTLQGGVDAPVNVPQIAARGRGEVPPGATNPGGRGAAPQGLNVSWIVWRGPGEVTFDPARIPVKDGVAVTTATFKVPGQYVLRATANDTMHSNVGLVTVNVTGSPATNNP